jgi:hypothetical protein
VDVFLTLGCPSDKLFVDGILSDWHQPASVESLAAIVAQPHLTEVAHANKWFGALPLATSYPAEAVMCYVVIHYLSNSAHESTLFTAVSCLHDLGLFINSRGRFATTVPSAFSLLVSLRYAFVPVARTLILAGLDPTCVDVAQNTLLHIIAQSGCYDAGFLIRTEKEDGKSVNSLLDLVRMCRAAGITERTPNIFGKRPEDIVKDNREEWNGLLWLSRQK